MSDKEILYQMLSREIDNILSRNPMFRMFSGPISNWVISIVDPYVDAFYMGTQNLNTEAASRFVKSEISSKVDDFITKFKEEQHRQ